MNFVQGCQDTTNTEQMVAFWTYTIDLHVRMVEFAIFPEELTHLSKETMHVTGTNTMVSFMGAVRSGFRESIQALPSDIREHVEKYITERLNKLREQKRTRKLLACDILFGTKDPFNCYYSEVRLREKSNINYL